MPDQAVAQSFPEYNASDPHEWCGRDAAPPAPSGSEDPKTGEGGNKVCVMWGRLPAIVRRDAVPAGH